MEQQQRHARGTLHKRKSVGVHGGMSVVPVWFLVVTLALPGDPARILGILSTPSRSHHFFNRALMLELAARGHQVTVFSPDPEAHPVPNYRDIVFEGAYAAVDAEYDYQQFRKLSHVAEDLQELLDSAPQGVIYMSLGTNVRSDRLSEQRLRAFLEAFQELPQRVLWKWESDSLPGQPPNVNITKWAPQNDVLAHSNVRAFVTQGGAMSMSEAVFHGVPVVGVPFLTDQYGNIRRAAHRGAAVELDSLALTKGAVLQALRRVLHQPSYRERMKHLSAIYRDRPQTALETAVWWTEYALRHHGAPHLRCSSLDLLWYQRHLLDVFAFLLLAAALSLTALYILLQKLTSVLLAGLGKVKIE